MMGAFRAGPTAYAHPGPANGHRSFNPPSARRRRRPASTISALAGAAARPRLRRNGAGRVRRRAARQRRRARRLGAGRRERSLEAGLGAARAQIHENYIVAQTRDSLVIVDQHAAHERLVYEALKQAMRARPLPAQMLLLPEIVDLPEDDVSRLAAHADTLRRFGLGIERFGPGAIAVRETPAMLGETDVQSLIRDLADEIADNDTVDTLQARLDRIASTMACHGSVRVGPAAQARGDERAAAADGGDAGLRHLQSRPADLYRAQAQRHRAAVRAALRVCAACWRAVSRALYPP